jgi:transcriptional regulator with XRE-family HTH domain
MGADITATGKILQPRTVWLAGYSLPAMPTDSRKILWENVSAIMRWRYGKSAQGKFLKDTGCGNGTVTRIKNQRTSVGIETLDKIATAYGLQAWHLLVPGLDPSNPPVVWLTQPERDLYKRLKAAAEEVAAYNKN